MFGSMYQSHSSPLLQCVPYLQWYLLRLAWFRLADHTPCAEWQGVVTYTSSVETFATVQSLIIPF